MKNRLESLRRIIEKETGHRIDIRRGKTDVTFARAVFCKIAREMREGDRPISYSSIGEVINKDHATVMHNVKVVFPFAIKEPEYNRLYLTLRAMFVEEGSQEDFDAMATISENMIRLTKENEALKYKLHLVSSQGDRWNAMTEGLSKDEMDELYDKLSIMVRAIRGRVYR